jgi:hypothetical protein
MNRLGICKCGSFDAIPTEPQNCEPVVLFMATKFKRLPSFTLVAPIDFDGLIPDFCPIDLNDERFTGWLFDV